MTAQAIRSQTGSVDRNEKNSQVVRTDPRTEKLNDPFVNFIPDWLMPQIL